MKSVALLLVLPLFVLVGFSGVGSASSEAILAAQELLSSPLDVPAPPSISWECIGEKEVEIAQEYAQMVTRDEDEIIAVLLSKESLAEDFPAGSWSLALMNRKLEKVGKLITTYMPDPEKLMAVFHTAKLVWNEYGRFFSSVVPDQSALLGWAESARAYYLTQEHYFEALGAALELNKMCYYLGGQQTEDIAEAMTFKSKGAWLLYNGQRGGKP